MTLGYITVKKSNSSGLPYEVKLNGDSGLCYDAEGVLVSIAEVLMSQYEGRRVILRNSLPKEDKALKKTLDILVKGHNWSLRLNQKGVLAGEREARKILRSVQPQSL